MTTFNPQIGEVEVTSKPAPPVVRLTGATNYPAAGTPIRATKGKSVIYGKVYQHGNRKSFIELSRFAMAVTIEGLGSLSTPFLLHYSDWLIELNPEDYPQ